ncbi:MAG: SDR family NAD(P)-dependent oxidoreductase [Opitutales bacterium]
MGETKRIIVTGVSRGIGRALFEYYAARPESYSVAGMARSAEAIDQLKAQFPDADAQVCDVRSRISVEKWAAHAMETLGGLDLLILNAAATLKPQRFDRAKLQEIEDILNTNYAGTIRVIHSLLPALRSSAGVIAHVTLPASGFPPAGLIPYAISKQGAGLLLDLLAAESPKNLTRVNIFPGVVDTRLTRSIMGNKAENYPDAAKWAETNAQRIADLGPEDNGKHLSLMQG